MASVTIQPAPHFADLAQQRDAARLGMWVFLATEVLFFGSIFAAYALTRMQYAEGFAIASGHTDKFWGTVETAVLLTSSATMTWAVRCAQLGARAAVGRLLTISMILGITFFAIHLHEYAQEFAEGFVPGPRFTYEGPLAPQVEMFFYLYYVATLLHLAHLMIGVGVVGAIAWLNRRGRYTPDYYTPVEITSLYWHFVDIVWIFLYPLFYLAGG